jgi:hypothetical protein
MTDWLESFFDADYIRLRGAREAPGVTAAQVDGLWKVNTSLGYTTDEDDVAILRTLRDALRPGGLVFVETRAGL